MKVSKRDLGLLLGAVGVLLAVIVYSLVFTPYRDKTAALDAELVGLQEEEAELVELESSQDYYQTEIDRLTEENDEILEQFPAGIQPEDEIMLIVDMEKTVDIDIPSISYGTPTAISGAAAVAAAEGEAAEGTEGEAAAGEAAASEGMTAYQLMMNVSYSTSYQGLKDAINYTNDHLNRMIIDTVSVSYDASTGLTTGSMTFNLYYITGTDKVYESPEVPEGTLGVNNIFGTRE